MQANELTLQIVEKSGEEGETLGFLRIRNGSSVPLAHKWRLYYSLGLTPAATESRLRQVHVDGRYGYLEPTDSWQPLAPGNSVDVAIDGWLFDRMPLRGRQGFHFTFGEPGLNDKVEPQIPRIEEPLLAPLEQVQHDWIRTISPSTDSDLLTPDHSFERNGVTETTDSNPTIIPSPRQADFEGEQVHAAGLKITDRHLKIVLKEYEHKNGLPVRVHLDGNLSIESYQLSVTNDEILITASEERAVFYAAHTLRQLILPEAGGISVAKTRIIDSPDFEHRCLFIDIARHFYGLEALKKIVGAMSAYKLNRLQLGISNDEGWRLEIKDLPELTEIGARRTFFATDSEGKPAGLYPAWGDGPEESYGYLTRSDFIELLRFSAGHHVEIIPEFNLPAHANAIIRAMTASGRYQLIDPDDKSIHQSAQGYQHNTVNVCLPDTYRFAADVIAAIQSCYDEAEVGFSLLHMGGDEVPTGTWLHSPVCQSSEVWNPAWDPEQDAEAITEALTTHYVTRLEAVVKETSPDTRLCFWHEMSPHLPDDFDGQVNAWTTEAGDTDLVNAVIERRQQLVISNASYLYLDMPYALHPNEPGLPWAAYIDTKQIYHFDPLDCWNIDEDRSSQVKGLQAQLWAETIFSESLLHYHLFPRLLAVAERAWNAKPLAGNWPGFASALGARELPYLESAGIEFRVPPPGAKKIDGRLHGNITFPGLALHYTIDGTEPDIDSPIYTTPIELDEIDVVRMITVTSAGRKSNVIEVDCSARD